MSTREYMDIRELEQGQPRICIRYLDVSNTSGARKIVGIIGFPPNLMGGVASYVRVLI